MAVVPLYLLDTDVCIEILRGNREVIERRAQTAGRVVTTWITAAELSYGAAKSRDPEGNARAAAAFLSTLGILGLDQRSSFFFGQLKARLERAGQRLADADLLIAAIALAHDATVVTGNLRHFGRIDGLACSDWIHEMAGWVHEPERPYDAAHRRERILGFLPGDPGQGALDQVGLDEPGDDH
ncbi:MAG: type II toxin-antitoxin system VapC family toxin [Acidobacteriota bacterium]